MILFLINLIFSSLYVEFHLTLIRNTFFFNFFVILCHQKNHKNKYLKKIIF